MKSRFDSSRFDSSLLGLQWALRLVILAMALLALAACSDDPTGNRGTAVSVQVTAGSPTIEAGDSVVLSAAPKQADGTTRTDVEISWLSTDTSIARVEGRAGQNAMVVGKKQGTVTIRAFAANKVGATVLNVVVVEEPSPNVYVTKPHAFWSSHMTAGRDWWRSQPGLHSSLVAINRG